VSIAIHEFVLKIYLLFSLDKLKGFFIFKCL